jgi:hypothetical protein
MSYRPKNQELETPINNILDNIELFNEHSNERIKSNVWRTSHILKLYNVRTKLLAIQLDLLEIKNETW